MMTVLLNMIIDYNSVADADHKIHCVMTVADIMSLEEEGKILIFAKGYWFIVNKAPYYSIPKYRIKSEEIKLKNAPHYKEEDSPVISPPQEPCGSNPR